MFGDIYRGRRVLITGHTGFKGSWLSAWLKNLGAEVTGLALDPPTNPNHFDLLKLVIKDLRIDINDEGAVKEAVSKAAPEIVFHLAAQPLVRYSYRAPVETWRTNIMGGVNLLEACRDLPGLKAIIFITTDKCYENKENCAPFLEDDKLGGHDPYSASKAAAEILAASYRDAFFKGKPLIATTRAGNVIGGGDWALDRLIPDLMRAQAQQQDLVIRSPNAVRPWQHVLEPLSGYLQLGQALLADQPDFQGGWNFGPEKEDAMSVSQILTRMGAKWRVENADLHESQLLMLDSRKAHEKLGWRPVLSMDEQLALTADWYRGYYDGGEVLTGMQIEYYQSMAQKQKASWAT